MRIRVGLVASLALALCVATAWAQEGRDGERPGGRDGGRDGGRRGDGERGDRGGFRLPIIVALDADNNGELSEAEINNAAKALKSLDKNNDGKVARDEMMPQFGGFGGGRGPGGFGGNFNSADFAAGMVRRMLENDANKDGKLAKDEVSERMRENFDTSDANKDGYLDKAEIEKVAQDISERFRQGQGFGRGQRGDGDRGRDGEGDRRPRRPPAEEGGNSGNPRL